MSLIFLFHPKIKNKLTMFGTKLIGTIAQLLLDDDVNETIVDLMSCVNTMNDQEKIQHAHEIEKLKMFLDSHQWNGNRFDSGVKPITIQNFLEQMENRISNSPVPESQTLGAGNKSNDTIFQNNPVIDPVSNENNTEEQTLQMLVYSVVSKLHATPHEFNRIMKYFREDLHALPKNQKKKYGVAISKIHDFYSQHGWRRDLDKFVGHELDAQTIETFLTYKSMDELNINQPERKVWKKLERKAWKKRKHVKTLSTAEQFCGSIGNNTFPTTHNMVYGSHKNKSVSVSNNVGKSSVSRNSTVTNNSPEMMTFRIVIQTAIEQINASALDSGTSLPVATMFENFDNFLDEDSKVILKNKLNFVKKTMKDMGWSSSGFYSPPQKSRVVEELQKTIMY
jgi:hypothetical protein